MTTPAEVAEFASPDGYAKMRLKMRLHPKQGAVLRDMFRPRSRVSLLAANGVGKTATVATAAILYCLEVLDGAVISTSGSWAQVVNQLVPRLKDHQHRFPSWDFQSDAIKISGVNRYMGFSCRDEGTAQGYHADPTRPLLAIIDEAAAVSPAIFKAIEDRCCPTYFLVMGSPLDPAGTFYDIEHTLRPHYTHHHISQTDCLISDGYWIDQADIDRKIAKYGADHPFILSNIYGKFGMLIQGACVTLTDWQQCVNYPPALRDGDLHLFFDVAGGGANNVGAFRRGNKVKIVRRWRQASEMAAIGEMIEIMHQLKQSDGLEPHQVSMDVSGAGKPMADRMQELGYPVNRFNGGLPPRFDADYLNCRAECQGYYASQVKACALILPDDEDLRVQTLNIVMQSGPKGKRKVKSKEDMAKEGLASPDTLDAVAGCSMQAPFNQSFNLVKQPEPEDNRWLPKTPQYDDQAQGTRRFY